MEVSIKYDKARARWRLETHIPTGEPDRPYKRQRRWFKSEEIARAEGAKFKDSVRVHGVAAVQIDLGQYNRFLTLDHKAQAAGLTLEACVDRSIAAELAAKASPLLDDAVLQFVLQRRSDGAVKAWETALNKYLTRFTAVVSNKRTCDVTLAELDAFVLKSSQNQETRANVRRVLVNFCGYAKDRGWMSDNLAMRVPTPRIVREEPEIIIHENAKRLLEDCWQHQAELVPYLALRLFTGLRKSSVLKMTWEEIKVGKGIILKAKNAKTRARAYLEGFPPILWEWLKPFERAKGPVARQHFAKEVEVRAAALEIAIPRSSFRHTFSTYHVAAFRNAAETAQLVAHRESPRTLWTHYVGIASEEEGKAFFAIKPPTTAPTFSSLGKCASKVALYREHQGQVTSPHPSQSLSQHT
jgi:integrase